MKLLIPLLCFFPITLNAQNFLVDNEISLFSFETENHEFVQLATDSSESYLICRYGKGNELLWEFPSTKDSSWKQFSYSWYLRGGGPQNEGLDLNYLGFEIDGIKHIIYQEYSASDDKSETGWKKGNSEDEHQMISKAIPSSVDGLLMQFRDNDKLIQLD